MTIYIVSNALLIKLSPYGFLLSLTLRYLEERALLNLTGRLQIYSAKQIRVQQHSQYCLYYILDLLIRQPLFLTKHFLAHQSVLDVWVVDGRPKFEVWEFERVLFREVDVEDELVAVIWASEGPIDEQFPAIQIFLKRRHDSP